MATGTVKYYDEQRGFGFIETDAMQEDVFFHRDDVAGMQPVEGLKLEFEIRSAPRGPRAENVKEA